MAFRVSPRSVVGEAQVAQAVSFAASVSDLAGYRKRLLVVFDGLACLAQVGVGISQVAQVVSFAPPVPDLAADRQGLFVVFDGFARLAQVGVGVPQVAQVGSFAPSVPISRLIAGLVRSARWLSVAQVVLRRLASFCCDLAQRLSEYSMALARPGWYPRSQISFAPPVSDIASDLQGLFVVLDGLTRLAQVVVGVAQVAQGISFAASASDLAADCKGLLVIFDGLCESRPGWSRPSPGCPGGRLQHCDPPSSLLLLRPVSRQLIISRGCRRKSSTSTPSFA